MASTDPFGRSFEHRIDISSEQFMAAMREATEVIKRVAAHPAWRKFHTEHEFYLRRANRAYRRSYRNQPPAWTTHKDEWLWDTFGCDLELRAANASTHNRRRNKHGRTGVSRRERTNG